MRSISSQISSPAYPISATILQSIAKLTGAQIVLASSDGEWVEGTLEPRPQNSWNPASGNSVQHSYSVEYQSPPNTPIETSYHAGWFKFYSPRQPNVAWLIILFPESTFRQLRWQAAFFPLITGLSTALVLGGIASWLTNRVVKRIELVQQQVRRIAEGDYQEMQYEGPSDEIQSLSANVNQMCRDLKSLATRIHETERDRLVHSMAAGLSHDLRNTLTGARLALQLHARTCRSDTESTDVAMRQLRVAEDQLQRWLRMSGEEWIEGAEPISMGIDRALAMVQPTADHLSCQLKVARDPLIESRYIEKSALFSSAILNLLFNAVQAAGSHGEVSFSIFQNDDMSVTIEIADSGKGPEPSIQSRMFDPFVTSKPEGVGLGLPLVAKAAQQLGGSVQWRRDVDQTIFSFLFQPNR